MSKRPQLTAEKRDLIGRQVKQLRAKALLPGNVFGKKVKSLSIQIPLPDFKKLFSTAGETTLIDLLLKSESSPRAVLIANVQIHPVTQAILHVDFHQVTLTEKVTANIPIELTGEAPAAKELGGVVVNPVSELEIEALPTDLPDNFIIDLSTLKQIGDAFTISDLKFDKSKVVIAADPSTVLVTIQEPKEEVVEAPTPTEAEIPSAGEAAETKEGEPAPESTTQSEKSD
jgi:large subunit ribosomal protein L25